MGVCLCLCLSCLWVCVSVWREVEDDFFWEVVYKGKILSALRAFHWRERTSSFFLLRPQPLLLLLLLLTCLLSCGKRNVFWHLVFFIFYFAFLISGLPFFRSLRGLRSVAFHTLVGVGWMDGRMDGRRGLDFFTNMTRKSTLLYISLAPDSFLPCLHICACDIVYMCLYCSSHFWEYCQRDDLG